LDQVLARVPRWANENVLVGFDTADDAGVYKLTPECALVQTVDFFTPIVDDAYTFGAIAAANSLSDVYAMGGKPLTALSVLAWPAQGDLDELAEVLRGGAEKIHEAGCTLLGGHSVKDEEVKFGYAVTGTVHPDRVLANAGARAGDALVLTKAIGTGVIGTALKQGIARESDVAAAVESMLKLNRAACEAMLEFQVHGCTDVTGFGLIGHAREMALASHVTIELDPGSIRMLPGAVEYARQGAIPGGLKNNREFASSCVEGSAELETLLYDPQTSGGLLIALAERDAAALERKMPDAYRIGQVTERKGKPIRLLTS
jgi:selenide, water dikinase